MIEIERKFLVVSEDFKKESHKQIRITQGFLNSHKERTVRVRVTDNKGVLTIKGKSSKDGLTRFEWEQSIPLEEAKALLELCEEGMIDKIRYEVKVNNHIFEVDEFYGNNKGLIVAEIELQSKNEIFTKPSWLGEEVTGQVKYYNSLLSKHPYTSWIN